MCNLHCGLLNKVGLITIGLITFYHNIEKHEQHLQKGMYVRVKFLAYNKNPKAKLKNATCMLSL